jgi:hypothetical protein
MLNFEIKDRQYQAGRLSAMQQFHIARRLAPVITRMGEAGSFDLEQLKAGGGMLKAIQPLADAVAALPDVDCDYVIKLCLAVTMRKQNDVWVHIWHKQADKLMFEDIDMFEMLLIVSHILRDSIGAFFPAAGLSSP